MRASDARGPATTVFVAASAPMRVERLGRGDAEAAPLAGREAPEAVVAAELAAGLVDDAARSGHEAVAAEEVAVVVAAEEARLLALGPARRVEPGGLGLGARLLLRLVAEREPDAGERGLVEGGEHVALVLVRVGRAREQAAAVALDDPRVVAGGEPRSADAVGEREQLVEAEAAVAADARVRRLDLVRSPRTKGSTTAWRNSSRRSSVTCGMPRAWQARRAASTALGEQQARSVSDAFGSIQRRSVTPTAPGPALSSATALSTPPLIATAVRPGSGGAATTGPIAFASASAASVSPGTAAASSSVSPARSRSSPGASAATIRCPSTRSRTAAQSPSRDASPKSSCIRPA